MSDTTKRVDDLLKLFSANFNDGEPIRERLGSRDTWTADAIVEFVEDFVVPHFTKQLEEAEIRVARNAMAIALDWLENDGRGKHLVQDMWDVRDISVLDHIEKRFIDEARGHFPTALTQDTKGGKDE